MTEPIPDFDLYETLEVPATASMEMIEAAYRSRVERYDSDVSEAPDSVARATRLNLAHQWLGDPVRRARYDSYRAGGPWAAHPQGTNPPPSTPPAGAAREPDGSPQAAGPSSGSGAGATAKAWDRAAVGVVILGSAVILGSVGLAFAAYNAGLGGGAAVATSTPDRGGTTPSISSNPSDGAAASGSTLFEQRVTSLMAQIQANPEDVGALVALADEFYAVEQWQTAAMWLNKALVIEPQNTLALLAKGATSWNLGDPASAEALWLMVVELEPDNLEAHYDLGFLYLNQEPVDLEGVLREWSKVIELDPNSSLARDVRAQLDQLGLSSPLPSR